MMDMSTGRIAYPGLRPFTRDEFDLFFGREDCVDEMVDTLAASRFLAVLGTSGSGKSSLVKTGLLNALELGYLAAAGSTWQFADMRPRGHPIRSLAICLLALQGNENPDEGEIEILSAFLRRGPRSLVEWYDAGHLPADTNLLVLADQFEELFRYEDYSGREEAEAFVALLIEASREERLPLYVVITMRSEYLGACTLIDSLPEVINRGLYLTPRMTRAECRQAIVGPADVCGFEIEDSLVNNLLNDLTDFAPWEAEAGHDQTRRLGRRADQLPLMQHVLNLLWQRARSRDEDSVVLTLADYEEAGELGGALDRHANEVAASIPADHADVIDSVFRGLVTGRTVADAVRRPTRFDELVALAGGRTESVRAVIDAFRAPGVNFLTPGPGELIDDDDFIDISHESLIRQWRRLSECLDEEAKSAEYWSQLLLRAERHQAGRGGLLAGLDLDNQVAWWKSANPSEAWANRYGNHYELAKSFLEQSQTAERERSQAEEERQRKLIEAEEAARSGTRFKRLSGALAAAVVLAIVGAGAALYLWREANILAEQATQQAELAEDRRQEAEVAQREAEAARERAEALSEAAQRDREEAERLKAVAEDERAKALAAADDARRSAAEAVAAQKAAEVAQGEAEAARIEAELAREEAARANARRIAQQFSSRIGAQHAGLAQNPDDLARAGSLLARAAQAAYRDDPATASTETQTAIELMRPGLVLQDSLASTTIPAPPIADIAYTIPGADGLTALVTGSFLKDDSHLVLIDRSGRVVSRYKLPEMVINEPGSIITTAMIGPEIPVAAVIDSNGRLQMAFGPDGQFHEFDAEQTTRLDDIYYDAEADRLYVAYVRRDSDNRSVARLLILDRTRPGWKRWRPANDVGLPTPGTASAAFAGGTVLRDGTELIYVTAGQKVLELDENGDSYLIPDLGDVVSSVLTPDGRYILATNRAMDCEAPVPTSDPGAIDPRCLVLYDLVEGQAVWRGALQGTVALDTVRTLPPTDGVSFLTSATGQGSAADGQTGSGSEPTWIANDTWIETLEPGRRGWSSTRERLDLSPWEDVGFDSTFALAQATLGTLPATLDKTHIARLFDGRSLPRLAGRLEAPDMVLAHHIAGDTVRLIHRVFTPDELAGDDQIEFLVFGHGDDDFTADPSFPEEAITCLPGPDGRHGVCVFSASAYSPDGTLAVMASNYGDIVVVSGDNVSKWPAELIAGDGDELLGSLTALLPLDAEGHRFLGRTTSDNFWLLDLSDVEAPTLKSIDLSLELLEVIGEIDGVTADSSTGTVFMWGPPGLLVLDIRNPDTPVFSSRAAFSNRAISDLASLDDGTFAVATTDGEVLLFRLDGDRLLPLDSGETGLSSSGSIRLSVANGRVLANAGNDYWLRSVGYAVEDDQLVQHYVIPWDNFAGQLDSGEMVSVRFGPEIFGEPAALLSDKELLALTIMRENYLDSDGWTEFRPVIDMLSPERDGMGAVDVAPCGTAIAVAARVEEGEALTQALDTVRRFCRTSPGGQAFADAAALGGRERILALMRLAISNPYALELLTATLRTVAPGAANTFEANQPWLAEFASDELMSRIASGEPVPDGLATSYAEREGGNDPYSHWLLAVMAEREDRDAASLANALEHYAIAERLFRAVDWPVPDHIASRRIALARVLADNRVVEVFDSIQSRPLVDDPIGSESGDAVASLSEVATWLNDIDDVSESDYKGFVALLALVEEGLGDEVLTSDPEAAAQHYRTALELMLPPFAVPLSEPGGTLGYIREIKGLGEKLEAAGAVDAAARAASAILVTVGAEPDINVARSRAVRNALREAFEVLAEADADVIDFDGLESVGYSYLDHDWETRFQAIDQTGPAGFLAELKAASVFMDRLAEYSEDRAARWQAVAGQLRFWMSTVAGEAGSDDPALDPAILLDRAIADLEAADAIAPLASWDAVILAYAYSQQISETNDPTVASAFLAQARDAFSRVIFGSDLETLSDYRQRLAFDGYVVALERGLTGLRRALILPDGDGPLSDEDKAALADATLRILEIAETRDAARKAAEENDLLILNSGWALDKSGDPLWGAVVGQVGGYLRQRNDANGPATECDVLAAHPYDVERTARAVPFADIDADAAKAACINWTPREDFNRARALDKSGDTLGGLELLIDAAQGGVPIAYNNLALLISEKDPVTANELLTTFAARSLEKAYVDLADFLKPDLDTPAERETFRWLADKAAGYDVAEAHRDLADMPGQTAFDRGFHLAVAAELFGTDGRFGEADAATADLASLDLSTEDIRSIQAAVDERQAPFLTEIDESLKARILGFW